MMMLDLTESAFYRLLPCPVLHRYPLFGFGIKSVLFGHGQHGTGGGNVLRKNNTIVYRLLKEGFVFVPKNSACNLVLLSLDWANKCLDWHLFAIDFLFITTNFGCGQADERAALVGCN